VTNDMAVIGRLCLGLFVGPARSSRASAVSLVTQAAALFAIARTTDTAVFLWPAPFMGFSIGNLITLRH